MWGKRVKVMGGFLGVVATPWVLKSIEQYQIDHSNSLSALANGISVENIKKEVEEKSNNKSGNNIKEGEQQHVIVVGAGVVGVSTAYFLARDYNYKVTVIEKESQSAAATSWGNAGVFNSTFGIPFASFSTIFSTFLPSRNNTNNNDHFKYFYLNTSEMIKDASFIKWAIAFLKKTFSLDCVLRAQFHQSLKRYSIDTFLDILSRENLELDIKKGVIDLFESNEALEKEFQIQKAHGVICEKLSVDQTVEKEPILGELRSKFIGSIYTPNDFATDCPVYTRSLSSILKEKYGVDFQYNKEVESLLCNEKKEIEGVKLQNGEEIRAKAVVLCVASDSNLISLFSPSLKSTSKLRNIPVFPMRGYSIRLPVTDNNIINIDESGDKIRIDSKLAVKYVITLSHFYITRMNEREVNFASIGEFTSSRSPITYTKNGECLHAMKDFILAHFSHSFIRSNEKNELNEEEIWMGRRPLSADGNPIVSPVLPNLFINCGHGMYGWMLSSATGKITAALVNGSLSGNDVLPSPLLSSYLFLNRFA